MCIIVKSDFSSNYQNEIQVANALFTRELSSRNGLNLEYPQSKIQLNLREFVYIDRGILEN